MADQTVAASSPAEVSDVFNGENVSLAEFNRYRQDGELPDRFKPEPAESAPADAPEETAETEGDEPETAPAAEPEDAQELTQKAKTKKRIEQLLAEKKELQRKLEAAAKPDANPGSSPAQAQQPQAPRNFAEWESQFKPSKWLEEYAKANPQAEYEDATYAMARYAAKVEKHFDSIEQRVQAEMRALESKVSEARERYEDFEEIRGNFISKAVAEDRTPLIPVEVLKAINDSDRIADLLYVIGGDETALNEFIALAKSDPVKAIKRVGQLEVGITQELSKAKAEPSTKAPEKKQTTAPKPPSPVGGASTRSFDVSDESLTADEWMRKRNKQLANKG